MGVIEIINRIDAVSISSDAVITQMKHEEDDGLYQVWRIDDGGNTYILKEAKGNEKEIYDLLISGLKIGAPTLYQSVTHNGKEYLLLEYVDGEDLCKCNRQSLTMVLDVLIEMQKRTWTDAFDSSGYYYEESLKQREGRKDHLNDSVLEMAYAHFLKVYKKTPRALCHDDLLPFNVICSDKGATLIDWEYGGILPYPTPLARLIAHAEQKDDALFFMTDSDKEFAIEYYYEKLVRDKGITHSEWLNTLDAFLLYEYCEWVFVGNKYDAKNGEYYLKYLPIASDQARKMLDKLDV